MAMVTSFVLINAAPDRTAALAEALADLDDVAEVYSVAGDFDLVAVVRVRHHDDLADVVTKHIAAARRHHPHPHAGRLPGLQPAGPRRHVGYRRRCNDRSAPLACR